MALDAGVKRLGQVQITKVGPTRDVVEVVEISFSVDGEGPFKVDVPVDRYTPEIVEQEVGATVDRIRKSARLFGGS